MEVLGKVFFREKFLSCVALTSRKLFAEASNKSINANIKLAVIIPEKRLQNHSKIPLLCTNGTMPSTHQLRTVISVYVLRCRKAFQPHCSTVKVF